MNKFSPVLRASHVNSGTSVLRDELPWPKHEGPIIRSPELHLETEERATVTRFGGLALVQAFLRRFGVARLIDKHVRVFKIHNPYHESDHVLAQALNLYVGGTCLEDMMHLQHDAAVLRIFGACRLPDPTTAGDFLRRFETYRNPGALAGLRRANDELQQRVWNRQPRKERRRRRKQMMVLDIDSHIKPLCGEQKQGADFGYTGQWSYHPFVISMADTGECLAVRNRPGNATSAKGVEHVLDELLPRLRKHSKTVLLRGDSAFDRLPVRQVCQKHGVFFAFVSPEHRGRKGLGDSISDREFRPFLTRATRRRQAHRQATANFKSRRKGPNRRKQRARERNYKEMQLRRQWLVERPHKPLRESHTYRLVIRRQLIETRRGQQRLFDEYRYRYVLTSLPKEFSTEQVIDHTYQRCDQEKLIEQMGRHLAAWRMPVAEFDGNSAWLEMARLAWNLAKWIAQLALPGEVLRWQWKRFRLHYVFVAAQLIKRARQTWVRLLGPGSTVDPLLWAFDTL